MNDRHDQIKNLLWKEVARKSPAACITFSFVGILISFYYFGIEQYSFTFKILGVLIVISNAARLIVSRKIENSPRIVPDQKNQLRIAVWLNAVFYSIIFSMTIWKLNVSSWHFSIMIMMLTGFVASSLVTLAYDKLLFFPFQAFILVPPTIICLYQYSINLNPHGHILSLLFFILGLYQLRQYKDYKNQLLERFNAQLDLEFSFKQLKKSQTSLVEQTAKIVHASKISALSDMSGGLAHEVNNSLMVILGTTQQIQRELKKSAHITPSIESKFIQSTAAIKKISGVIEGLKYFSMQMDPQPKEIVPLKTIIERTMSYTYEMLKAHHVHFRTDEIPDVDIECHPFQITQVLFNIIKNADDAMEQTPAEKRWLRISYNLTSEFVLIKISNSGPLIPVANHSRLFQPFFTTKDVNQGTGLSLSVSKGIAKDHKGDLYFEEDEFTTFVLKLNIQR